MIIAWLVVMAGSILAALEVFLRRIFNFNRTFAKLVRSLSSAVGPLGSKKYCFREHATLAKNIRKASGRANRKAG